MKKELRVQPSEKYLYWRNSDMLILVSTSHVWTSFKDVKLLLNQRAESASLNLVSLWLLPGLCVGQCTVYPGYEFSMIFLSPYRQILLLQLQVVDDGFLPSLFDFMVHNHPLICVVLNNLCLWCSIYNLYCPELVVWMLRLLPRF
jgi:hypothetical protein